MHPCAAAGLSSTRFGGFLLRIVIGVVLMVPVGCQRDGSSGAQAPATEQESTPPPAAESEPSPAPTKPAKDAMARTMTRTPLKDAEPVADAEQGAALVAGQKARLGLGPDDALPLTGSTADERGNAYYQLQQTYKGVPVFGATGVLEIESGKAVALSGSWVADLAVNVQPALDAGAALGRAVGGGVSPGPAVSVRAPAELVVYVTSDGPRLAWHASVDVPDWAGEPFAGEVFVDANDGALLAKIPDRRTG